jgi:hypothetical protein
LTISELTEQVKLALAEKSIPEKAAFFPDSLKLNLESTVKEISF